LRRRRGDGWFYLEFGPLRTRDFSLLGLTVRFVINVAALYLSQLIIPGFDIESASGLIFGALIFGGVNAVVKPIVSFVSCPLTCLTLGLFLLIINAFMLALTGWIAGWFDLAFEVDGFWAALLGGLVIAVVSALLSSWADDAILGSPGAPGRDGW
jgi:putative membrane protein